MITINEDDIPEELTILEYFILYCLYHKIHCEPYPQHIESLENKRYIKTTDFIELRDKANKLFDISEDKYITEFLQVFNAYPLKTYTGRRLRPSKLEAKEAQEIFKKYKTKVLLKGLHSYVLKCLDNELEQRKKSNSFEFMHEMITWVNGEKWDRFAPVETIEEDTNTFKKDI